MYYSLHNTFDSIYSGTCQASADKGINQSDGCGITPLTFTVVTLLNYSTHHTMFALKLEKKVSDIYKLWHAVCQAFDMIK